MKYCSIFANYIYETVTREAMKSECTFKHGACLVYKNKIIAQGYNKYIYNKVNDKQRRYTIHAEVDCVAKIPPKAFDSTKLELYVVRINKQGDLKDSKPCNNCYNFLIRRNIHKIFFS